MCFVWISWASLGLCVLKPKKQSRQAQIGKIRIYIKILAVIKAHALGKLLENNMKDEAMWARDCEWDMENSVHNIMNSWLARVTRPIECECEVLAIKQI